VFGDLAYLASVLAFEASYAMVPKFSEDEEKNWHEKKRKEREIKSNNAD
jgi:hypothetical protein